MGAAQEAEEVRSPVEPNANHVSPTLGRILVSAALLALLAHGVIFACSGEELSKKCALLSIIFFWSSEFFWGSKWVRWAAPVVTMIPIAIFGVMATPWSTGRVAVRALGLFYVFMGAIGVSIMIFKSVGSYLSRRREYAAGRSRLLKFATRGLFLAVVAILVAVDLWRVTVP